MSDDHENEQHQHNKLDISTFSFDEVEDLFGEINELVNVAKKDLLYQIIRPQGWKVDWNIGNTNFKAFKKSHRLKFSGKILPGVDPKLEITGISHNPTGGDHAADFKYIPPNLVVQEDNSGLVVITTHFDIEGHGQLSHPHKASFHFNRIGENKFSLQFYGAGVGPIPVAHHDTGGGSPA